MPINFRKKQDAYLEALHESLFRLMCAFLVIEILAALACIAGRYGELL